MTDLQRALSLLENRTRRDILERLTREPHYPLQLSQQLGVSQQAIMKHLALLEEAGLVQSTRVPSEKGGPPKKSYSIQQSFSLRMDIGPDLFRVEQRNLPPGGPMRLASQVPDGASTVAERLGSRRRIPVGEAMELLAHLGEALESLDKQRDALIALHQHVRSRVSRSVEEGFEAYEERRLVHTLLETPRRQLDISGLSDDLSVGAGHVERMLDEVRSQILRELADRGGHVIAAQQGTALPWWAALQTGRGSSKQREVVDVATDDV